MIFLKTVVLSALSCFLTVVIAARGQRVKRIIGGVPADEPPFYNISGLSSSTTEAPAPEPLIFVRRDRKSAVVNGLQNNDDTYSFLGIRYAEPPIRRLRFQRPRRLKLKGEIDATKFGPPCPQWSPFKKRIVGKEDCLFLNVFTPQLPTDGGKPPSLPVLVWIHGGNFKTGSAAQYVPTHLVKKGIVVVTLNYRLGSLGFLSIGRKELPGNVGLFDISTAMRWIKDYIRFFGGNPRRIVPGGQGSGASCATMLALSSFTKSSLSGILAMSGSPVSPFSVDKFEAKTAEEVSTENNCQEQKGLRFVRCMQKLPLEQILNGDKTVEEKRKKSQEFPKGLANLLGPGPAEEGKEDGRFLPHFVLESPLEAIKKGTFPKIPLLTGVTKEETSGGVKGEVAQDVIAERKREHPWCPKVVFIQKNSATGNFLDTITKKLLSPSFLQSGLFKGALDANTGLYVNKTVDANLSSLFINGDYLKFFTMLISSALSDIDKVIKHTTDAFFNLPAFITSHLWSKKNKVYLYSFEHTPMKSVASEVLGGIPLVSPDGKDDGKKTGPEHGDDLIYLFDIRTIEGEPLNLNSSFSEADIRVREHFTNIVAEFARTGEPKIDGGEKWPPFTGDSGNYMVISDSPKQAKNFHKCEMGMWTGDNGILKSPECSVFNQASEIAKSTIGSAGSTLLSGADAVSGRLGINKLGENINKNIPTISNPLKPVPNPVGGLFGNTKKPEVTKTTEKSVITEATTTTKKSGILGSFSGGGLLG